MPATATQKAAADDDDGERPGAEAWSKAMRDLPDLPYKVETNARGQLILSPPKPEHGFSQSRTSRRIFEALGEVVGVEFSVYTSGGVKIPDVIWMSEERRAQISEDAEASPVMPELCVEIMPDSNTEAEMADKRRLYFDGGAEEVWIVDQGGGVRFFDADGPIEQSTLAPDFARKI